MIVIRFKSSSEAKDLLKKVKRMSKYSEELEDILEECVDDEDEDADFREEDDDEPSTSHRRGRRRYRKM